MLLCQMPPAGAVAAAEAASPWGRWVMGRGWQLGGAVPSSGYCGRAADGLLWGLLCTASASRAWAQPHWAGAAVAAGQGHWGALQSTGGTAQLWGQCTALGALHSSGGTAEHWEHCTALGALYSSRSTAEHCGALHSCRTTAEHWGRWGALHGTGTTAEHCWCLSSVWKLRRLLQWLGVSDPGSGHFQEEVPGASGSPEGSSEPFCSASLSALRWHCCSGGPGLQQGSATSAALLAGRSFRPRLQERSLPRPSSWHQVGMAVGKATLAAPPELLSLAPPGQQAVEQRLLSAAVALLFGFFCPPSLTSHLP